MRSCRIKPPNLLDHLDQALPLARQPRVGLVTDFDGTISEIAPTPDEAIISPGCAESIERLSFKLAVVSVASGRSAADLKEKVGLDGVVYVGNHGAEYLTDGERWVAPGATEYQERVRGVFDHLRVAGDSPGLAWQDKRLSASVHYRKAPDPGRARDNLTEALESAPGVEELEVFWGKMVLELRAPIGLDKGYALRKLARDRALDSLVFLGDDITDLDALRALRELTGQGDIRGLGVSVTYEDSAEALMEASDYSLNGVSEVETFLRWLDAAVG